MTDAPTASPERPSLETEPCRPDVLTRLRDLHDTAPGMDFMGDESRRWLLQTTADAIDAITGLRESDARRLRMIDTLKSDLALERDISAHRLEMIARLEVEMAEMRSAGMEGR